MQPECSPLIGYVNRNSHEVTLMPKPEEIAKKRSASSKILHMALPDAETRAFWALTADDPHEYAARVAGFSRALGGKAVTNAVQSSGHRWRDAANAASSRRSDFLGRVLALPKHSNLGSEPPDVCDARKTEVETESSQGGNMKAPGIRAKKRGTKLKRGQALQIMCYPRAGAKAVLVEASRDVNRPLSSFMVLAALKQAAALRGCEIVDLISADELRQYRTSRVDRKRSAAAKRASVKRRVKRK